MLSTLTNPLGYVVEILVALSVLLGIWAIISKFLRTMATKEDVKTAITECSRGRIPTCVEHMRTQFVPKEVYDAKHQVVETGVRNLENRMDKQIELMKQIEVHLGALAQKIHDFCNGKASKLGH